MHVAFCDNSFYCKISSDKLERRSDKLIHVRSIAIVQVAFFYLLLLSFLLALLILLLAFLFLPLAMLFLLQAMLFLLQAMLYFYLNKS